MSPLRAVSAPSGDLCGSRVLRAPQDQGEYWGRLFGLPFWRSKKVTGPARPQSALVAIQNTLVGINLGAMDCTYRIYDSLLQATSHNEPTRLAAPQPATFHKNTTGIPMNTQFNLLTLPSSPAVSLALAAQPVGV